jgi:hypothetical protein
MSIIIYGNISIVLIRKLVLKQKSYGGLYVLFYTISYEHTVALQGGGLEYISYHVKMGSLRSLRLLCPNFGIVSSNHRLLVASLLRYQHSRFDSTRLDSLHISFSCTVRLNCSLMDLAVSFISTI